MKQILAEQPKATIVIVHGAFEHSGRYEWLANRFCDEGYHCIYGDLPAHGEHDGKKGHIDSFQEYVATISKWVEQADTFGLPIFLLGHSMGGLAVIRTLQEKTLPIERVILSSPSLGLTFNPPKPLKVIASGLNILAPKIKFKSKMSSELVTRDPIVRANDEQDELILKKVSVKWFSELNKGMKVAFEKINSYPNLPTLVMQAGDDKIVDKGNTRKWFDSLTIEEKSYKEWGNLYHEIFNDPEKEKVFQYAKAFIELHSPKAT
ncbi:alpha/beta fold hydrolase [Pontibacillus yanchengensis]|uniref:Alpha/beta fold hydrolase n=2 Tax=Pontibacillus yanchengensis TaxID=462910 RepID=A0ACC7VMG2_9BACI|nr:alpha/beta hydrolase [Pontibacillus yanchengensis]MYL33817.1 alpha/beta fold hydrolase [Pontibacillus yanchengensis]MYL55726.1 alpha/beta fold hydrolase [Pontibacillus yanchengensis]